MKMEIKRLSLLISVLLFAISSPTFSQWRFPDCGDLEILNVEFSEPQNNALIVTVFNACDTCYQHVYTGLIAFGVGDTLAVDENLMSRPSPPNNGSLDYFLVVKKDFEIGDIDRIQMVGDLCDSLLLSPILGIRQTDSRAFPSKFFLYQNYPNPFNPETTIDFEIQFKSNVKLNIYNVQGQLVRQLVNDKLNPGRYSKTWNGTNQFNEKVASGLYVYQLIVGDSIDSRKLTLLN